MALTTLAEIQDKTGITDEESEAKLLVLRGIVERRWEQETNRLWVKREGHEQVIEVRGQGERSCGEYSVWPELYPLIAAGDDPGLSVEEKNWGSTTWSELAADGSAYEVMQKGGRLVRIGRSWGDLVRLTTTGGYDDTTVPEDVKDAILTQIQFKIVRMAGNFMAMSAQNFGEANVTWVGGDLHPAFVNAVENHRRRIF